MHLISLSLILNVSPSEPAFHSRGNAKPTTPSWDWATEDMSRELYSEHSSFGKASVLQASILWSDLSFMRAVLAWELHLPRDGLVLFCDRFFVQVLAGALQDNGRAKNCWGEDFWQGPHSDYSRTFWWLWCSSHSCKIPDASWHRYQQKRHPARHSHRHRSGLVRISILTSICAANDHGFTHTTNFENR